jgi:tetratricopeptide (TPR) repeat protein
MKEPDMLQRKSLIFRSFTLTLLCAFLWAAGAHAQDRCKTELAKAEQAYSEGFFEQALALTNACLNKGHLTPAELAWVHKLLGQIYISKNELRQARVHAQKLLEVAPDYEPDKDQDLQRWIELVTEVKQERERQIQQQQLTEPPEVKPIVREDSSKKGTGKKWLWLGGGGVLAAGVAAFLILQGDDTRQRLPDPPGLPPHP